MNQGWIYCMSNKSMPGLLKIGQTKNCPSLRAEKLQSTGVPLPFEIEFAKKINGYEKKEKIIHTILDQSKARINPKREFFRVEVNFVKNLFDLIDGVYFTKEDKDQEESLVLKEHLIDNQKLRHVISGKDFLEGSYCCKENKILYQNKKYSLQELHQYHCKNKKTDVNYSLFNFEFQIDKKWIPLTDLLN